MDDWGKTNRRARVLTVTVATAIRTAEFLSQDELVEAVELDKEAFSLMTTRENVDYMLTSSGVTVPSINVRPCRCLPGPMTIASMPFSL